VNLVNAIFETLGSIFGWLSVLKLARSKTVSGVFAPSFAVSAAWAVAAIPYYWVHEDKASASICVTRALAYIVWTVLWCHFSLQPRKKPDLRLVVKNVRSAPDHSTSSH
jgi:hypothetical protein